MTNETKTRPTHRIYAVTNSGGKKFWQPIGALWAHADGKGFNQRIDYLPLNDAQLVIRVIVGRMRFFACLSDRALADWSVPNPTDCTLGICHY
jgi:hypothetical protein